MISYDELLKLTKNSAQGAPDKDTPEETIALERFKTFFSDMTPERVREHISQVYAEDAYLFDTLKLLHGLDQIRPYFIKTAERAAGVKVEIMDTIRKGSDFYIKWQMDISWSAFKKGETTRSFGMSHLRFNRDGLVVMHFDFWDSTTGFFEHLPFVGMLIRWIKRKV